MPTSNYRRRLFSYSLLTGALYLSTYYSSCAEPGANAEFREVDYNKGEN